MVRRRVPTGQGGQPWPPQQPGPAGPPPPYGYPPQQQPPPPGSGYAFGPFAGQPGGPQGGPPGQPPYGNAPGPYGPGQPPTEPPPKRRGKVLIIVGALVLALIVGAIAVALLNRNDPVATQPPATASQNPSGAATTAPPTSAPPPAAKASDAVVGYLEALAAGSASAALSYAVDPVAAGPLLTDQVLAQSRKRAPLSGIEVPPVDDEQATTVTAAYRLGGTAVNTVFDVVKVGDEWKLVEVVKRVDVGLSRAKSVPMLVNGVKVSGNTVNVLPGSYAFSTGLSTISYGSKNVVLVKGPTDYVDTYAVKAQLSKSGQEGGGGGDQEELRQVPEIRRRQAQGLPEPLDQHHPEVRQELRDVEAARQGPLPPRDGHLLRGGRPGWWFPSTWAYRGLARSRVIAAPVPAGSPARPWRW